MPHLFISYSREDAEFMRYLRALLAGQGLTVWVDEGELVSGARWWKMIEDNIDSAAALLVIMSPHSRESDWVEREILKAEAARKPIFPILLAGPPWSRLANIQYEDMRAGLRAALSPRLAAALYTVCGPAPARAIAFRIVEDDITALASDIALFKFSGDFHGADFKMALRLGTEAGIDTSRLVPPAVEGGYVYLPTALAEGPSHVLYVNTRAPRDFGYADVRALTAVALHAAAQEAPQARSISMTMHGVGFGLDEREALLAQFAGLRDAIQSGTLPPALETITLVELSAARALRLQAVMDEVLSQAEYAAPLADEWGYRLHRSLDEAEPAAIQSAGQADDKPYAVVLTPPAPMLEDVYHYGVQTPIHAHGLLCEHIELAAYPSPAPEATDALMARLRGARLLVTLFEGRTFEMFVASAAIGAALALGCPVRVLYRAESDRPTWVEGVCPTLKVESIRGVEQWLAAALSEAR